MSLYITNFLLCLWLCLNQVKFFTGLSDFYFEAFELNGAKKIPLYGNASVKRTGNDHPKLFADFEITDDLRNYDLEVKVYYSRLGNNQFILMAYKLPRLPVCGQLKNEFFLKMFRSMQNCSNLPVSEDPNVDICDLMPLGHYYLRSCVISDPSLFPYRMPMGRFRFVTYFYKRGENEVFHTMVTQICAT